MPEENNKMKKDWEDKAKENAYHWVDSSKPKWQKDAYYDKGSSDAEKLLIKFLKNKEYYRDKTENMIALEIGCGTGRLLRRLAQDFGTVYGVDISEEMIGRAKEDNKDIGNAHFELGNGVDLKSHDDNSIDFVYSYIVFQHLPSRKVVENYYREAYRILKPGGGIKSQVRGYPGKLKIGIAPFRFMGFNAFFIALADKYYVPYPVIRSYDTLRGAFFKSHEIEKLLKNIGFKDVESWQDPNNQRYLWTTATK